MPHIDDDDIVDVQRRQVDARAQLKAALLAGENTGPTRAEINALARRLTARVARIAVTDEERQEMRLKARRARVARVASEIDQELARRLALLNPPHKKES